MKRLATRNGWFVPVDARPPAGQQGLTIVTAGQRRRLSGAAAEQGPRDGS
jgi:hypothetical protein